MQILSHSMIAKTISAYCTLAQIMLVIPVGSVDNERQFSSMNFVMYARRNALQEAHLNACCRVRASGHSQSTFPFDRALQIWLGAKDRRSLYV